MRSKSAKGKPSLRAPISEIFASYQGEGIYVGEPQVFIRFAGCNLRCGYCDTPKSQSLAEDQKYVALEHIVSQVRELSKKKLSSDDDSAPRTVSITGGEPLLYTAFLSKLLPELKKAGMKIYLETNGTLPEAFGRVRKWVGVVAMDIKLPSDCGEKLWELHKRFLFTALAKAFVKVVITGKTADAEVASAVKLVASVSPKIPFVFQPVTPQAKTPAVEPSKIARWTALARKKLSCVSVLPQMHKIWEVR